jgi:hypothetical protein
MTNKVNLTADQATTFNLTVELNDQSGNALDVTGYSVKSKFRKHYMSDNSVSFTTSLSNGQLILSLSANATVNVESGRYVYDVELADGSNNIIRLMEGILTINPAVTKWQ